MGPTLIVVDRELHRMEVWRKPPLARNYKLKRSYLVTVGKQGHETPHGLYFVGNRTREPDWMIPMDPDYPPESWGQIIPFGAPGNPFLSAFISLEGPETGVGFHDTTFDPKLGTASSHGCIRMAQHDVLEIYKWCRKGTPVYLH